MSIKKSAKNSLKAPDKEILRLALLMARIALSLDCEGLRSLIGYCSAFLSDSEFQRVFKIARSFILDQSVAGVGCDDWLVSSLYSLYDPSVNAGNFSDLFKG